MKSSLQHKTGCVCFGGRNLSVNDEQKEQADWLEDKEVHAASAPGTTGMAKSSRQTVPKKGLWMFFDPFFFI